MRPGPGREAAWVSPLTCRKNGWRQSGQLEGIGVGNPRRGQSAAPARLHAQGQGAARKVGWSGARNPATRSRSETSSAVAAAGRSAVEQPHAERDRLAVDLAHALQGSAVARADEVGDSGRAEGQPRAVFEEVLGFSTAVGLPITLAEIGLTELPRPLLRQIAERATAKGETIHNEPFEVRPDMVEDAVLAADAAGRAWQKAHGRRHD